MRSTGKKNSAFALARLLPAVLMLISLTAYGAQPAESHPGSIAAYDAAHEITVTGTVQEVVTKRTLGSPAGMHLIVSGSEGTVDAHVGPFLPKDVQEALHSGVLIQIVGAMETLHGKQFLLARQLIFSGRLVTVRNKNGFLVRGAQMPRITNQNLASSELNGGAR